MATHLSNWTTRKQAIKIRNEAIKSGYPKSKVHIKSQTVPHGLLSENKRYKQYKVMKWR